VTVDATGNVGIGRNDPRTVLEVSGSTNRPLTVNSTNTESVVTFTDAGTTSIGHVKAGSSGDDFVVYAGGGSNPKMTIDANGSVTSFDQKITALKKSNGAYVSMDLTNPLGVGLYINDGNESKVELREDGAGLFSGTVASVGYATRDGVSGSHSGNYFNIQWGNLGGQAELWIDSTKIGAISTTTRTSQQLIQVLSTLRNATKDETTIKGLRDALADAIGGLIENLEHEIATMPAPEPEVSTMEEAE